MPLLAYGLIALAILGTLGGIGYKVRESGKDAIRIEWAEANAKARADEEARSAAAAKELLAERAKRKVIIQKRTVYADREVEKLVYRSICLPDTGLCLVNAAILGTVAPGCFADGTVPPVKPPG